jgi:hypothetical protein
MKKIGLLLLLIVFICALFAAQINFSGSKSFNLFNKHTGKIIKYQLLDPGDSIVYTATGADTLQLYTRVINDSRNLEFYEYEIKLKDFKEVIQKNINNSSVTRGLGGEKVSAFNFVTISPENYEKEIKVKNISEMKMLVKLRSNKVKKTVNEVEFIRYSPSLFSEQIILQVNDKSYTYHSANHKPVELTLEGPVFLKIVSRMIFENTISNKKKYRFSVFDNNELISVYDEDAYKSKKALIKNDFAKTPSSGDTNIVRLGDGIHKIRIEDNDKSKQLIFRLYISKSSVGIESYE